MSAREELDLILSLIRKYNLPLSPILEYAINEKKGEYPEPQKATSASHENINIEHKIAPVVQKVVTDDSEKIKLTKEIIEAARTPNGGFTRKQLAALGVSWPVQGNWIKEKIGTYITKEQLEEFNHIEYSVDKTTKSISSFFKSSRTYLDIAIDDKDRKRLEAVLKALDHFDVPATPHDISRSISSYAWGGTVREDSVDTILKRLPEVEYVPWGKYILKSKKK